MAILCSELIYHCWIAVLRLCLGISIPECFTENLADGSLKKAFEA